MASNHSLRQASLILLAVGVLIGLAQAKSATNAQEARARTIELSSGWEFRQSGSEADARNAAWLPAVVPGDVHLDLLRNKLIPSPFYRDNEAKLQWIQDAGWEYRSNFHVDSDLMRYRNVDLVFDGLDTVAQVYLNGHLVLNSDNMFREWRIQAKPYLKEGANELLVVFPSPIKAAHDAATPDKWRVETETPEKNYVRKAAYEYGWDWGPTFVTSGIWKKVKLQAWQGARISDLYIRQRDVSSRAAHLEAELQITAAQNCEGDASIQMISPSGQRIEFSRHTTLVAGVNHIVFPIEVSNPELWYPAGYGAHPLYSFHASVNCDHQFEDEATAHTGLRSVELRREKDQWGRSFEFVVNGIPVFAKGADVIPFDSFPNRATTDQIRSILQSAADANMNMVRVWGGGYYETDEFYTICDELGIMVWQDFMFGNEWQPGTYTFKQSVQAEVEHQVERLRNHPSIVLWCGNNETEISWEWNRLKAITDHLNPETRRRMWQDYLTLFSGVIPRVVERLNAETPYWPSSPSADYEDVSDTYQSGDMHDWSVWHGRAPFSEYEKHFPRFMSEYGFQSFPDMRTIEAFTEPEDRTSIFTPVMLAHQKNDEGNSIIHDYMRKYYGEPKDFLSFLYASQVLQAEGVKIGAEHLRRNMPRSMGSLYWQLNDCWPVASWSSIDYYGHWKALQYYARRFYNPVLVSPTIENGNLAVYVVSDNVTPLHATLNLSVQTMSGEIVRDYSLPIEISPLTSKAYLTIPMQELRRDNPDFANVFATANVNVNGTTLSTNLIYLLPVNQIKLPAAVITHQMSRTADGFTLELSSPVLARSVYISFGDEDAHLSDNYFDLLPNQHLKIAVSSKASLEKLQASMRIMSLCDAFSIKAVKTGSEMVPANPDWK